MSTVDNHFHAEFANVPSFQKRSRNYGEELEDGGWKTKYQTYTWWTRTDLGLKKLKPVLNIMQLTSTQVKIRL